MNWLLARSCASLGAGFLFALACVNSLQGQVVISELMYHPPPALPEDPRQEWIELYNSGTNQVDLTGWRLAKGVSFSFTNSTLPAGGYLVVAANQAAFRSNYPLVTNVVGDWTGKLRNSGETLLLEDALGQTVDRVTYANEGDWAMRRPGDPYPGKPTWWVGWQWTTPADGAGRTLELLNASLPNSYGQNWAASQVDGGTPGRPNSVATNHLAPFILDVQHAPAIPRSTNTVFVTARILAEPAATPNVSAFYRVDGAANFLSLPMLDDGAHGDGAAGDGIYGAVLPAQPDRTIVEFYVQARDADGRTRTWPAPTDDTGTQAANALYQVDELDYPGSQPIYRFIFKASEWNAWLNLMDNVTGGQYANPQMNATIVRVDGTGTGVRYCANVRNRGAGTRAAHPHNLHLSIPRDQPLQGITRLDFNTRTVHSQVAGNALFSAADLLNAYGAPVQVRINGANLANATPTPGSVNTFQFGSYYCFEPYDSEWTDNHIPGDSAGNIYKGTWYLDGIKLVNGGDLAYLGTNLVLYEEAYSPTGPTASSGPYSKQSNSSEDDWSDLLQLTYVLSPNTPDSNYLAAVSQVINIEQWLRYFAVNSFVLNMETTLSTGVGDDYSMYRGMLDPRFQLLNHDLDTVLAQGDAAPDYTRSVFKAGDISVLSRFLKHPQIAPRYFAVLKQLADTTFAASSIGQLLDQTLGGWVPAGYIQSMKDAAERRRTNILAQIPLALTVQSALTASNGYPRTTSATTSLSGSANAIQTASVLVNGSLATYVPWQGSWTASGINLNPGINRVLVQALDGNGLECARTNIDLWYDDGSLQVVGGTISTNTTWAAMAGPYFVSSSLTVASNVTLTLQPGTTVYFGSNVNFTIANGGRLLAEGLPTAPIRFSVMPGTNISWGGLTINGSIGSPETRIAYAHFESNSTVCIEVADGTIALDHATFGTTTHQYLALDGASFLVSYCIFPSSTVGFELVHGTRGIKPGGRGIVRDCFFGTTSGYNDIMDFTGGNRDQNQPIIQYYNNVFIGATDDILDLDGTDAWIEGNIFLHVHKNGAPDSSSAISGGLTGSDTSQITIVRNLFFDCDDAVTAKEGNFYTLLNNTIVHTTKAGGLDSASGIVNLRDTEPSVTTFGAGCYLEANIVVDAEQLVRNYDSNQTAVTFSNNILPLAWTGPGGANLLIDPQLKHIPAVAEAQFSSWEQAQVMWDWFSLRPSSPALGRGPNGVDLGALIPAGATLSGEPPTPTASTQATLVVGTVRTGNGIPPSGFPNGSGYTHYRWRLDDAPWSAETPISTPIILNNLGNGPHHVEISGKRDSGWFQDAVELGPDALVTTSLTWTVDTTLPGLRLNEVLARNASTLVTNGESPDLVELYNAGAAPVSLAGKSLTDDPLNPTKFVFPPGISLTSGQYLVLFAEKGPDPSRYLGFGFAQNGDQLLLFDAQTNGGALLDSVSFGPQLVDLSIGRLADGSWGLCRPTFGGPNAAQPLGNIYSLRLNEWLTTATAALPDDFVELYNGDSAPVALAGLFLTDAPAGTPARHQIASLSFIDANGYFAFKADGHTDAGPEHLNFSLATEQGAIGLFAPDLTRIDTVCYGPQSTGISQGRSPNGALTLAFFTTPTPGSGNPASAFGSVTNYTLNYLLIPLTNSWRYNASGADLGTAWKETNYVDSLWSNGPALFGLETSSPYPYPYPILTPLKLTNSAGKTIITYYFRTTFIAPTNLTGLSINTEIYLDDGAVFYLNGNRIGDIRLTNSVVTYTNLAKNQGSEGIRESIPIPASILLPGTNLLAVEVHQTSASSTDIAFGMAMTASGTFSVTNFNTVVLNEILADNDSLTNLDGTITDWIELYNPATNAAHLDGFSLTDDVTQPRRWLFPAGVSVPPHGYLLLRCDPSSLASRVNGPVLNTGFGLAAEGDNVYLFDSTGALGDAVRFGPQANAFSIGRVPDGNPDWTITLPSPASRNIAAATGDTDNVRINEWAASVANGPDWFELYNPNPQPVSLGGLYLTDKLSNRTKHLIPPLSFIGVGMNGYLKFIADNDTAQGPNHVSFTLDANPGEALGLFPPGTGPAIDSLTFGLQTTGLSEGRLPDGSTNRVFFPHPSPGAANWLPLSSVVINEVLTHTDLPLEDAIELHNLSASNLYVGGWYLSDAQRSLRKFRIPDGTVIPGAGYLTFYEFQFNADPTQPESFSFSSAKGDELWLTACDTNGAFTGYRDFVQFGPQFNGVSFGRFQTSVGIEFTALNALTFGSAVTAQSPTNQIGLFRAGAGAANAYPRVGPVIITELMYRPPPVGTNDNLDDEFIELHNLSGLPVPLYDTAHPTNGWHLRGAVSFDFNTNHVLPPGGFLLVVGFDPVSNPVALAAFRNHYGTNGQILGPWSGKLANTGETIELRQPDSPQTTGPDVGLVPYVTVERIVYSNVAPWPTGADGTGLSLQRANFSAYGNDPANWSAATPNAGFSGVLDTDGDGLPDAWELAHGLNPLVNDANLDPDHDGFTNLQEYLAGTDPQTAASCLRLESITPTAAGAQIRFTAAAGHTYSILYCDDIRTGAWLKLADISAPSTTQAVTVPDPAPAGRNARYYRLVTPQLP